MYCFQRPPSRCTMFLVDEARDQLVSYVADGGRTIRIPRSAGIAGACATAAATINIPDAYADPRFNRSVDLQTGYKTDSLLAMPICTPIGVPHLRVKRSRFRATYIAGPSLAKEYSKATCFIYFTFI